MKCPFCNFNDTRVIDSRLSEDSKAVRRRRECTAQECLKRFTTYETVEALPILVIKSNGVRQAFDARKIKLGIMKATEKRQVSARDIDLVVAEIEKEIHNSLVQEIESKKIGNMIMERLKNLDEVSYVRFASVHRQFKDINTLRDEIERLINKK
ncbi:MAG: transcriptional regulator NrdR [Firmicutes bacterium]|nr:transcriptional regulator NrdR [Bacillota bacterium]